MPETKKDRETPTVKLETPHGTIVQVPRRRAVALLKRQAIELPGGVTAKFVRVDDDTPVKVPREDSAMAPTDHSDLPDLPEAVAAGSNQGKARKAAIKATPATPVNLVPPGGDK